MFLEPEPLTSSDSSGAGMRGLRVIECFRLYVKVESLPSHEMRRRKGPSTVARRLGERCRIASHLPPPLPCRAHGMTLDAGRRRSLQTPLGLGFTPIHPQQQLAVQGYRRSQEDGGCQITCTATLQGVGSMVYNAIAGAAFM